MGEHPNDFNNLTIDRDGLGGGKDEVTFFRKKRRKRRRPERVPPTDDEETKENPVSGDRKISKGEK